MVKRKRRHFAPAAGGLGGGGQEGEINGIHQIYDSKTL
jgi:hypothetical protein